MTGGFARSLCFLLFAGALPGLILSGCGSGHKNGKGDPSAPVSVEITSPADQALLNSSSPQVSGTISSSVTSVDVSGFPATISGTTYTVTVNLADGPNTLVATAQNALGDTSTFSIEVVVDTLPPVFTLDSPVDQTLVRQSSVFVSGTVSDPTATVTVSGLPATLTPGGFQVEAPLQEGANTLTVTATDPAGNTTTFSVQVGSDTVAPQIAIVTPPTGALLAQSPVMVTGTIDESTAVVTVAGVAANVASGSFFADVPLVEGGNVLTATAVDPAGNSGQSAVLVTLDTTPPVVRITTPAHGSVVYTDTVAVTGTVDDSAAAVVVSGQPVAVTAGQWSLASVPVALGANTLTAVATDAAGNVRQDSAQVDRQAVALTALSLEPAGVHFDAVDDQQPLLLRGLFNDGSSVDLTTEAGTTYTSSNPFVASVDAAGLVTAKASGQTSIEADSQGLTAASEVTVELGVTLTSLELSPGTVTLVGQNATQQLSVEGSFSNGSVRDLSPGSTGTVYQSDNPLLASVGVDGLVRAEGAGTATITATNGQATDSTQVEVMITTGAGFLHGEVYDDSLGLPLANASVSLLADGGGARSPPLEVGVDANGEFLLSGQSGPAVVRVESPGFTAVERLATIPAGTAQRLLDTRLTLLDDSVTSVSSATGGVATNSKGELALTFGAGALAADADLQLTRISNQGLAGVLPAGWSPVAVVDIAPAGLEFAQPAQLALPNDFNFPASSAVDLSTYDAATHQWVGAAPARVSVNGQTITAPLEGTGQVALLLADVTPLAPPALQTGVPLEGVALGSLPAAPVVQTDVVPPSAPPGPEAQAVGSIVVTPAQALPSGTPVVAQVSEIFDLLDGTQIVPRPFDEDLLLYQLPFGTGANELGTEFPVTPSRDFTLQELSLGVVLIDVTAPGASIAGSVVGSSGAFVGDGAGTTVQIPAGALAAGAVVEARALDPASLPVALPPELDVLGGVSLDLVGAVLAQSAQLSIPRPASAEDGDPVFVAQLIRDSLGALRLRIVAMGLVQESAIVSFNNADGTVLPGITAGGDYVFLHPTTPLSLIAGSVLAPGGVAPKAGALVESDTSLFADVTPASGRYAVAGHSHSPTVVSARDLVLGDAVAGTITAGPPGTTTPLDLVLAPIAPSLLSSDPVDGAVDIPLDAPLTALFSKALDPASVDAATALTLGDGTPVASTRALSTDGQTLWVLADAGLASLTDYILTLGVGLSDLAGNALATPAAIAFATLDTSKPPQPSAGQIIATLPDPQGEVQVIASQGTAEALSGVTVSNLATQETFTALAQEDGSFRLRIDATVGDELALTFRNAAGQDVTVLVTQFEGSDGTVGFGDAGGTATDPLGRIARILPDALQVPTELKIEEPSSPGGLPILPANYHYVDEFDVTLTGGQFKRLVELTLKESQNRFPPAIDRATPFANSGSLVVPLDFLVNGTVKFSARAEDENGDRRSVELDTLIVGGAPDTTRVEVGELGRFPTVFLSAPAQGLPNQQLAASAVAPAARIDFELPVPAGLVGTPDLLLVRLTELAGVDKLAVVDRLEVVDVASTPMLLTTGRDMPGAILGGSYAVVEAPTDFVDVSGRNTGPAATIALRDTPFVYETRGPNEAFLLPIAPNTNFELDFTDPESGSVNGTATGQTPATGSLDLGEPLGADAGNLSVRAQPETGFVVDPAASLLLTFSEPIDATTLSGELVVTDSLGNRIFGTTSISADNRAVTFTPLRRFAFGRDYRYGVSTRLLALSGARLAEPFQASFSVFTPRVLGSSDFDFVRDVAVVGDVAIAGGDLGLTVLDVSTPDDLEVAEQLPVGGGVTGVELADGVSFNDRNGEAVAGRLGFALSGDDTSAGLLRIFDLNTLGSAAFLGSAQLTNPSGSVAPAGVPDAPGTPSSVALREDFEVLLAVTELGVESVTPGEAIPDDPGNPGAPLGPRYPAAGFESANDVVVLEDELLVAGAGGLTILDATTFEAIAQVSTTGDAQAVAGLAAFEMDINGSGVLEADETFDLAVVANGSDGTLQFFDLRVPSSPILISAVRLPHAVDSVALSRSERMAFAGCGASGVALVDLSGPSSIQPIDLDFDTLDDRVLGIVPTPGAAGRIALDLGRGVGYVADGTAGVSVLQLVPPRTVIRDLMRDPVAASVGDETPVTDTLPALLTDDALLVTVDAAIPPQTFLFLTIEEEALVDGQRVLAFPDGSTSVQLEEGTHTLTLLVSGVLAPAENGLRSAALHVRDTGGNILAEHTFTVAEATFAASDVVELFAAPESLVLLPGALDAPLSVGGTLFDGRVVNLTASAAGTTYRVADPVIASVDGEGLVTGNAAGTTNLEIANGALTAWASVEMQGAAVVADITVFPEYATLTSAGQTLSVRVDGRYSYGAVQDLASGFGAVYSSTDAAIAGVDNDGVVTANGEGVTTITVDFNGLVDTVEVNVEFRTVPAVSSIALSPVASVFSDAGGVLVRADLVGTGSLEGLPVVFNPTGVGGAPVTVQSEVGGIAQVFLEALSPGSGSVEVSVVDPTSGLTRSDSEPLTVIAAGEDLEPNDTFAQATPVSGSEVSGTVGGDDTADVFQFTSDTGGNILVGISLPFDTDPTGVTLIVRDESGTETARQALTSTEDDLTATIAAGSNTLSLESSIGPVAYTLRTRVEQEPVTIANVSPSSGGPGTLVTVTGTGFSTDTRANLVFFGGIAGAVTSASSTSLQVVVPAAGVDAALSISVGSSTAAGPVFTVGNTILPDIEVTPPDVTMIRVDPVSGARLVVNRLVVGFDPIVDRPAVAAAAAALGGTVVSYLPAFNIYELEFPGNSTVAGIQGLAAAFDAMPDVSTAVPHLLMQTAAGATHLDNRDLHNMSTRAGAYQLIKLDEALEAVRSSVKFKDAANIRPVRVAVLDTGFDSAFIKETKAFIDVEYIEATGPLDPSTFPCLLMPEHPFNHDVDGHGTLVTSVIAASNNRTGMNGILSGLYQPEPAEVAKVHVLVYGVAVLKTAVPYLHKDDLELSHVAILAALEDVNRRNRCTPADRVDSVNMSFGYGYEEKSGAYTESMEQRAPFIEALESSSLVAISAGNGGVDAKYQSPASAAGTMPHVIAVGGVAVSNWDGTGETADHRAIFGRPKPRYANFKNSMQCSSPPAPGSNCGAIIALAAPAEDVLGYQGLGVTGGRKADKGRLNGTSVAAPMVAAAAALLQAIRPTPQPFTPARLREILVETADPISRTWAPGDMKRLNLLSAVRAVLEPIDKQFIWIADRNEDTPLPTAPGKASGKLVALDVDPLDGQPVALAKDVPLTFARDGVTFQGTHPTSLAVSPVGDVAYVIADDTGSRGAGIVVVDTLEAVAEDFIPFCGGVFPAACGSASPVVVTTEKPGIAFSRDGRLAYVSTGKRIVIVNTDTRLIVTRYRDLPPPYDARASRMNRTDSLAVRLQKVADRLQRSVGAESLPGTGFGDLQVSPDGKRLYALMETGLGGGRQPGGISNINIDLYTDGDSSRFGLQPSLDNYFTFATPDELTEKSSTIPDIAKGDEPKAIAVAPDGKHVYLVNGGVNFFRGTPPDDLQIGHYTNLFGMSMMSMQVMGTIGGLTGLMAGMSAQAFVNQLLFTQLIMDIKAQMNSGRTQIAAEGNTSVFSSKTHASPSGPQTIGNREWLYPALVGFGWNPPAGSGLLTNQFDYNEVFASRPFDMVIRPDGRRAISPYYLTGNIGVMDLDVQNRMRVLPNPNQALAGLDPESFQAVAGVTPALLLDNHLWPRRGVMSVFRVGATETSKLQSPDEAALFSWDAAYAQNGRFSVVSHAGSAPPYTESVYMPDFESDVSGALRPLIELGFSYSGGNTIKDPKGFTRTVGETATFERGGGAITIIDDVAMDADFNANADESYPSPNGIDRPWYTAHPICKTVGIELLPVCSADVFTRLFGYNSTVAAKQRFHRPRGIAMQPFVTFDQPRFGDFVGPGQAVEILWREPRVAKVSFAFHLFNSATSAWEIKGETAPIVLTSVQRSKKNFKRDLSTLYRIATGAYPQNGKHYRIEARICQASDACSRSIAAGTREETISMEQIEVQYGVQSASASGCSAAVAVSPNPLKILHGQEKQFNYRITLAPSDSLTSEVAIDVDVPTAEINLKKLAVTITPETDGRLAGNPIVKLKKEKGTEERFAMNDFDVNVSFSTRN